MTVLNILGMVAVAIGVVGAVLAIIGVSRTEAEKPEAEGEPDKEN